MIINARRSSSEVPAIIVTFNVNWFFLTDIRKNFQISNLMKMFPVGAKLYRTDAQTWRSQ